MNRPTDLELRHGVDVEPQLGSTLGAGPLEATLLDGELRFVRIGSVEVARRIHVAVRDQAWDTIPGSRTRETVSTDDAGFHVVFESRHETADLGFSWQASIEGSADGTISYECAGVALRDFPYRRIGLCVLHPTDEFAGCKFVASSPAGQVTGRLPELVGPQPFDGSVFEPLFPAFDRLEFTTSSGLVVAFEFEGDLFEMEDQRNWTDATFKSYSQSPVARVDAWPLTDGAQIRQRVTISATAASLPSIKPRPQTVVSVGERCCGRLPEIGLSLPAEHPDLPTSAAPPLSDLGIGHVRVEVPLDDPRWGRRLDCAVSASARLGCALELALFMGPGAEGQLQLLDRRLAEAGCAIRRVIVYERGRELTGDSAVSRVRAACRVSLAGVPIGGGTDVYFAELNRVGRVPADWDLVAYPVTPQVHAEDDVSLAETPAAQADTVARARSLAPGKQICVTPITLKPRYNPDDPDARTPDGELPANVDVRQMSLLAAGWMLASISRLGRAGTTSATYFATTGWRGVVDADPLPPRPARFPSIAGMLFPVYHLLHALSQRAGAQIVDTSSSDPLAIEVLHARDHERDGGLLALANLTGARRRVRVAPLRGPIDVVRLDPAAARAAAADRSALRSRRQSVSPDVGDAVELELPPFELVFITRPESI